MLLILSPRSPHKVSYAVILFVAVEVTALMIRRFRPVKRDENKLMNEMLRRETGLPQRDTYVPAGMPQWTKNPLGDFSSCRPKTPDKAHDSLT